MTSQRTAKTILNRSLARSRQPVLLFDSQRTIAFANPAAEKLLGFGIEELSSVTCHYSESPCQDRLAEITGRVCPPPELFLGDKSASRRLENSPVVASASENLDASDRPGRSENESRLDDFENWVIHFQSLVLEDESVFVLAIFSQSAGAVADTKPSLSETMRQVVRATSDFHTQNSRLENFIGESEPIRQVLVKSKAAIASGANLVVFGPPGSGREHLARGIHEIRAAKWIRDSDPSHDAGDDDGDHLRRLLVPLDGKVADPELVQSAFRELFDLQTLYDPPPNRLLIRNADSLSPASQNELLGLLKLREFDLSITSTSETSLTQSLRERPFDPTLASLLSTVEIEIPALADRIGDIPILAQMFLEQYNARGGRQLSGFSEQAMDALLQYPWPGNVDELKEFVEQSCEAAASTTVGESDLPKKIKMTLAAEAHPQTEPEPIQLDEFLRGIEREIIERALTRSKGNKTRAAALLGINRARLIRRLEKSDPSNSKNENARRDPNSDPEQTDDDH